MRTALAGLGLLAAVLPMSVAAQAADVETCQGKPATIVQTQGTVMGTDGDDVIIGGHDTKVVAGKGNDTICVTGGDADGGQGVDSIEVRGIDHEEFMTLTDFEHLDVDLAFGIDGVRLKWNEPPVELSGTLDGGESTDIVSVRAPDQVRLDLKDGRVTLGPDLFVTIANFENAAAIAPVVRAFGDHERNYIYLSGCDVVAKGGQGRDRLWMLRKKVDSECPGVRLYGQGGNDKLRGSDRDDVLIGGPGRDLAEGRDGRDRCVAEKTVDCER